MAVRFVVIIYFIDEREFNINTSHGAYFTNPIDVTNIFTRVTGANPTNINGTLGVLGNANLFLMNPNGIVFGTAAKLDLKGSFFGTTANNIKFADGSEFTISNQNTPVLSVSVPVGLGFGSNSGAITNQSRTTNSNGQIVGLQVQSNQTLGLIGGEVTSSGGYLTAPFGRIELGSVGAGNQVYLTPHNNSFALGYANVNNFQDIKLTNAASVNTSGVGGGEIQIVGRQVKVRDGSQVINQTTGSQPGGMLTVRASELVELSGTTSDLTKQSADGLIASGLITTTVGKGDAGAITIDTNRLTIQGGAVILTSSFAGGNSGNININTSDLIELDGIAYTNEFINRVIQGKPQWFDIRNGIRTEVWNTGNSGEITINTNKLIARSGAQISSGSSNGTGAKTGNAATLTINARSGVELSGFSPDGRLTTVLLSGTLGTGAGSNLNINTKQLILRDGGALNSGTSGKNVGGDLTVNAESIEMTGARSNITSGADWFIRTSSRRQCHN